MVLARFSPTDAGAAFKSWTVVTTVAWVTVGLCLALMVVRVASAVSLQQPLLAITSGAEEEVLLSLWRAAVSQDVYTDPFTIPFTASYYNWLFYALYGMLPGKLLGSVGLSWDWLPTVGRLISLALTSVGSLLAWRALSLVGKGAASRLSLVLALYVFFGPLIGFWAIALHPELPAMVITVGACLVILRHHGPLPITTVIVVSLLSLAAWSLKQSHVFLGGTLFLFLIWQKNWRGVATCLVVHGLGIYLTFVLGGAIYLKMMFFSGTDVTFGIEQLAHNLLNGVAKTLPVLSIIVVGLASLSIRCLTEPGVRLGLLGSGVSLLLSVPASAKIGASESYYFVPCWFLSLFAIALLARQSGKLRWPSLATIIAGWGVTAILVSTVLTGHAGVRSVREWHDRNVAERACIRNLPGPLLSLASLYHPLPWMTAAEPRYLRSYNYLADRRAGRAFEAGGIGGLIAAGYFTTLVTVKGVNPAWDGAEFLPKYRLSHDCAGLEIWTRRP